MFKLFKKSRFSTHLPFTLEWERSGWERERLGAGAGAGMVGSGSGWERERLGAGAVGSESGSSWEQEQQGTKESTQNGFNFLLIFSPPDW